MKNAEQQLALKISEAAADNNQMSRIHPFEHYKTCVEIIDKLNARRFVLNGSFFVVFCQIVIVYSAAPVYFLEPYRFVVQFGAALSGLLLAVVWRAILKHYSDRYHVRLRVIYEIEEKMSAQPIKLENAYLDEAQSNTRWKWLRDETKVEMVMPLLTCLVAVAGIFLTLISMYSHYLTRL